MKTTSLVNLLLVLVICFLLNLQANSELVAQQNIYHLTLANYNEAKQNLTNLVVLYINGQRVSRNFYPQFEKVVSKVKKDRNVRDKINFAVVNATSQVELSTKLEIKAYPTIFLFKDGEKIKYKSFWSASDFESWLKLNLVKVRKSSKQVQSADQFERRRMLQQSMIAFFGTNEDTPEFDTYLSLTEHKKEYYYTHTFDLQSKQNYDVNENEQALVLLIKEERKSYEHKFTGNYLNETDMLHFIKVYTYPGLIESENNVMYNRVFDSSLPSLILAYNNSNPTHQQIKTNVMNLRTQFYKQIIIGIFDLETADAGHSFFEDFRLPNKVVPALTYIGRQGGKHHQYALQLNLPALNRELDSVRQTDDQIEYIQKRVIEIQKRHFSERLGEPQILEFIRQAQAGELERIVRKQKEPENNDHPLKVLVRDTFNKFVNTPGKDVLIVFNVPQCHECDLLLPIVKRVALKLSNNQNLLFGVIDMYLNELDEVDEQKKFPSLKLFTQNDKQNSIDILFQTKESGLIQFLQNAITVNWVAPLQEEQISQSQHYIQSTHDEL